MKADLPWPLASILESMLSCNILVGNLAQSNISLIKSEWPEQLDKRCEQAGRHRRNAGACCLLPSLAKAAEPHVGSAPPAWLTAAAHPEPLTAQQLIQPWLWRPKKHFCFPSFIPKKIYVKLFSAVFQDRSTTNPGNWYIYFTVKKQT